MSKGRKIFAALCAGVIALAVASLVAWLLADWVGTHGPVVTIVVVLLPYAVFGVVAAGLYTWAVDGPIVSHDPR